MIRIKVYYLDTPVKDENDLKNKEYFLIQKKSLLKGGFRAFLLQEPDNFTNKDWYKKFQDKENVKFYIQGSGVYKLVNLDLVEGELYFEKSETPVYSKNCIFMDIPFDNEFKSGILKKIKGEFSDIIQVDTIEGYTNNKGAVKLDKEIFKAIRYSLIFIADITPISTDNQISNKDKWIANSNVMTELGYALAVKDNNNIIITYNNDHNSDKISFPFDIQSYLNKPYSLDQDNGFEDLFHVLENKLEEFGL